MKNFLIEKIMTYSANIAWEIDDPLLYGCIGWNGMLTEDSYWHEIGMKQYTVLDLKKCISLLKKYKRMTTV